MHNAGLFDCCENRSWSDWRLTARDVVDVDTDPRLVDCQKSWTPVSPVIRGEPGPECTQAGVWASK